MNQEKETNFFVKSSTSCIVSGIGLLRVSGKVKVESPDKAARLPNITFGRALHILPYKIRKVYKIYTKGNKVTL